MNKKSKSKGGQNSPKSKKRDQRPPRVRISTEELIAREEAERRVKAEEEGRRFRKNPSPSQRQNAMKAENNRRTLAENLKKFNRCKNELQRYLHCENIYKERGADARFARGFLFYIGHTIYNLSFDRMHKVTECNFNTIRKWTQSYEGDRILRETQFKGDPNIHTKIGDYFLKYMNILGVSFSSQQRYVLKKYYNADNQRYSRDRIQRNERSLKGRTEIYTADGQRKRVHNHNLVYKWVKDGKCMKRLLVAHRFYGPGKERYSEDDVKYGVGKHSHCPKKRGFYTRHVANRHSAYTAFVEVDGVRTYISDNQRCDAIKAMEKYSHLSASVKKRLAEIGYEVKDAIVGIRPTENGVEKKDFHQFDNAIWEDHERYDNVFEYIANKYYYKPNDGNKEDFMAMINAGFKRGKGRPPRPLRYVQLPKERLQIRIDQELQNGKGLDANTISTRHINDLRKIFVAMNKAYPENNDMHWGQHPYDKMSRQKLYRNTINKQEFTSPPKFIYTKNGLGQSIVKTSKGKKVFLISATGDTVIPLYQTKTKAEIEAEKLAKQKERKKRKKKIRKMKKMIKKQSSSLRIV